MHKHAGLIGHGTCGLNMCTPVKSLHDFNTWVCCFGNLFQDFSLEGVVTADLLFLLVEAEGMALADIERYLTGAF